MPWEKIFLEARFFSQKKFFFLNIKIERQNFEIPVFSFLCVFKTGVFEKALLQSQYRKKLGARVLPLQKRQKSDNDPPHRDAEEKER